MADHLDIPSDELQNKLRSLRNDYLELLQACLTGSIYGDPSRSPSGPGAFDPHLRAHGLDWPAHAQTMIGEKRLENLRVLTESVIAENVPGDLIETGAWRGGACILMRAVLFANAVTDRRVWVADSFKGLPTGNELRYPADAGSDFHTYTQLAVSLDEVRENFRLYGLLDAQIVFLEGWFKDTLPTAPIERLALMRLDGDMYESTIDALTNLYPKLSPRGYVIVDDYHVVPACKAAVYDYCIKNGITPEIIEIDGAGVYWKKSDIAGHDKAPVRPMYEVVSPEKHITRLNEAIAELHRHVILQLNCSLTERDSEVAGLGRALAERNGEIAGLRRSLTERDSEVAGLSRSLKGRETEIARLGRSLYTQGAEITRLNTDVDALHSSVSWRITAPVRAVKNFMNAVQSRYKNSGFGKSAVNQPPVQHSFADEPSPKCNENEGIPVQASTEKKHIYEYEVDLTSEMAAAKVVRMVGQNKRVLEIGAGPGSIAKILTERSGCRVTGVEIDPSAIVKLTRYCEAVYQCDLNSPDWVLRLSACGTYDVIVAADIFEHLYDPMSTLTALKPFFSPDGYLVISLPHIGNNIIIAGIFNSDFEYGDYGLLDRTHIRFFGIKNMQRLVESSGYTILSAEYVITPPEQTELAAQWERIPEFLKAALERNHYGSIYQVVMKVAPAQTGIDGINLADLPVPRCVNAPKKS